MSHAPTTRVPDHHRHVNPRNRRADHDRQAGCAASPTTRHPGRRHHPAPQWLADRAGRASRADRRSAAQHGVVAGRALPARSPTTGGPSRASRSSTRRISTSRRALPLDHAWLGLAWHPDGKRLFSSGAAQNVVNELGWNGEALKAGEPIVIAQARPQADVRDAEGFRVRRRRLGLAGWHQALCGPGVRLRRVDDRSRAAEGRADRSLERGAVFVAGVGGRPIAIRIALGRRQAAGARCRDARAQGRHARRRASERDAPVEGRLAAVHRLRQHQRRLGRRPRGAARDRTDWRRAVSERASWNDPERAGALARRRDAARRQRRQQHRRRRRRRRRPARATCAASFRPAGIRPASRSTATAGGSTS